MWTCTLLKWVQLLSPDTKCYYHDSHSHVRGQEQQDEIESLQMSITREILQIQRQQRHEQTVDNSNGCLTATDTTAAAALGHCHHGLLPQEWLQLRASVLGSGLLLLSIAL
jgi:hypothetical protein